jgi:hypothetical protein
MPALVSRCLALGWLALLVGPLGCARSEPVAALSVVVVDDRGEALAEVALVLLARGTARVGQRDGALLARSDARGRASLQHAQLSQGTSLSVRCPEAYRPAAPVPLAAGALPRTLQFVCRPRLRTLALVAYAPGSAGALLRADAQGLGRIAPDGTLHTVLRRAPGTRVALTLETEPARTRTIEVHDRDEIILFDTGL